jgi:hypothetical protein
MGLIDLTSDLSRKDNPEKITKIIGRPSPTAIIRDTVRVANFLISPKGLIFNIKQFALQLMNPNTENVAGRAGVGLTKIYDPISPLTNTIGAPLGIRTDRHMPPIVRSKLSTYEGIIKARIPLNTEQTGNRLLNLRDELILGKSTKVGGLLKKIQKIGNFFGGYKGMPINTISGLTGPHSIGGIGATTIRRYEDTTKANLQNQAEINDFIMRNSDKVGWELIGEIFEAATSVQHPTKTLGKYRAISYGQIPDRAHSTTIIDFRKIRDSQALTEKEIEKAYEESDYSLEENRTGNFKNSLKLINDINKDTDESLIDFRFSDITFKAYLGMLSDNFAPAWDSTPDQGRADSRYQYTGFERTISFDFTVAIEGVKTTTKIWQKLQDLAQLTHPVYGSNGFYGQTVNVTIGKLFNQRPMIIQDLGYDWDSEHPWEIDPDRQHPLYTSVNMTCIVLGPRPQSNSILYNIPGLENG